jgi:hypothetical protein
MRRNKGNKHKNLRVFFPLLFIAARAFESSHFCWKCDRKRSKFAELPSSVQTRSRLRCLALVFRQTPNRNWIEFRIHKRRLCVDFVTRCQTFEEISLLLFNSIAWKTTPERRTEGRKVLYLPPFHRPKSFEARQKQVESYVSGRDAIIRQKERKTTEKNCLLLLIENDVHTKITINQICPLLSRSSKFRKKNRRKRISFFLFDLSYRQCGGIDMNQMIVVWIWIGWFMFGMKKWWDWAGRGNGEECKQKGGMKEGVEGSVTTQKSGLTIGVDRWIRQY